MVYSLVVLVEMDVELYGGDGLQWSESKSSVECGRYGDEVVVVE